MRTIFPLACQAHCKQTRVSYNLISKLMWREKISGLTAPKLLIRQYLHNSRLMC